MAIWKDYHLIKGLEVSKGGAVRRTYDDCRTWSGKGEPKLLTRKTFSDGNVYVEIRVPEKKKLRVDELVAKCFYKDVARTSTEQTFIIHKDGDKTHCWANNLQWATPYEHGLFYQNDPFVNTSDGYRLVKDDVYISKEGKVKVNGEVLNVYDSFFDSDMDREAAVDPFVFIEEERRRVRFYIDENVAAAFLPKPDEIKYPALLHIDNDYKNYSLDNLKWVEDDSEEYVLYLEKKTADIEKRIEELNPYPIKHLMIG